MDIELNVKTIKVNDHLIEIEMKFRPNFDNPVLEMPSWTPGSYLIRDYARQVQNFDASSNGSSVKWMKISKNSWELKVGKGNEVVVNYAVYAYELTVRTSYLDNRKGLISPASVFMYVLDSNSDYNSKNEKYLLSFETLPDWDVYCSLRLTDSHFVATDFDELIDSPVALGTKEVLHVTRYEFEGNREKPIPCLVVLVGDKGNHDLLKFVEDLKKIQTEAVRMFGELPYDSYLWALYIVGSGGGGLEHKYSNFSIIPRWSFKDTKDYNKLLGLEAHEHFHVYNIKRIRPSQLGPFDYSKEVYTKLLWVAEGLTSFVDNLILPRSGLSDVKWYLKQIADEIKKIDNIPGRKHYSLAEASFDAWIKLYKSDENTMNSSISYYLKGGIVGMCMDIEIRMQTDNTKSLDDFFRYMYAMYKENQQGYEESRIQEYLEQSTGTNLERFFNNYINGITEIDYNKYLGYLGYELKKEHKKSIPWIGLDFKKDTKTVRFVHSDSPAIKAGVYFKDEIIAVNGFKAGGKGLEIALKNCAKGEKIEVLLFRDDKLITTIIEPADPQPDEYSIDETENYNSELCINVRKSFFNLTTEGANEA